MVSGVLAYPEYKEERWNFPTGNLAGDQRHRARLWVNYRLPWAQGLTLSVLQSLTSGIPYEYRELHQLGDAERGQCDPVRDQPRLCDAAAWKRHGLLLHCP